MEWLFRLLIDPVLIWFALLSLVVALFLRANKKIARVGFAIFLVVTLLVSNLNMAFQAAQPLENFALREFRLEVQQSASLSRCDFKEIVPTSNWSSPPLVKT